MLKQAENQFRHYLVQRILKTLYIITRCPNGMQCWDCFLIDWDKLKQFFEKYKEGYFADFGVTLTARRGFVPHKLRKEMYNKLYVTQLVDREFLLIMLSREGIDEIFYVLSDTDKKQDLREATSIEDIQNYGKILYSTLDVDPPEAVPIGEIIKRILSIDNGSYLGVDRGHMTVRKGEIQRIKEFLAKGGNVNCIDKYSWTMLHHAAHCGNLDIISLLLNSGCNIHAQDYCGRKPAHIAARESHLKVIELFLKNGVSVNETDKNGWTLLHYAAWKGDLRTVVFLIHNMAETNVKDKCLGKRPIHIAAQEGHRQIVEILLENGVHIEDVDEGGRTPFYYSVWGRQLEMARFLFDRGANIGIANKNGIVPLHLAVSTLLKNYDIITFLLDKGIDINHKSNSGLTPLHQAALSGDLDSATFLTEKGANLFAVTNNGKTPLTFAKEHIKVASYLADRMVGMLQMQGRYDDALKIYEELIQIQKEKLGFDHTETLRTHFEATKMFYEQARFVDAMNILKNAYKDGLHSDHLDVLYKKCKLGMSICDAQTKFEETVECFKEVFKKWKEDLSDDHLDTLSIACDKAYGHFKKCDYEETFNTFRVALMQKKSIDQLD